MKDISSLGLPLLLLSALWGAVNIVLTTYGVINTKRDQILGLIAECGKCSEKILGPEVIYWTNLLPLSVGLCLVLAIVTFAVVSVPTYLKVEDEAVARKIQNISWFTASLPIFAFFAFAGGAVFDAFTIFSRL